MGMSVPTVLVAGTSGDEIKALLPFAQAIAQTLNGRASILGLVAVPHDESLSTGALAARHLRAEVEATAHRAGAPVAVRVAHDIWRELNAATREETYAFVMLHWRNLPPREYLPTLPRDILAVKPPFPKSLRRILLPIRGGPFAAAALRLAVDLAQQYDAEITALHAAPRQRRADQSYQEVVDHLRELPQVTRWVDARGDAVTAIIQAARGHQLVVMGAIANPQPSDPPIGPTVARVLSQSRIPALAVRLAQPAPNQEASPVDYTISVVVDKWFAENTFHSAEFQNLKQLVALKEKQGLTISLGLPTLNEEKTISKILRTVQASFVEAYPLLDEIVVIDSNSTDRTVAIAESLGIRVVKHRGVLTRYGRREGKGEALWNSLYVLHGDLIAWIDTDIVNIHPRFVYGILGPLIHEPRLMYVKGFYHRPLKLGRKIEARGGGRVTELVARPLLNLFYPELSGLIQPLAGEYAGRRAALECVPFFTGYGVEIGLLIDILGRFGLSAIGQVDLAERVHRNQSLIALSKMAFEIIQVVMARVGVEHQVELVNELNKSMKLIHYERNAFQLDVADIRARERPPMISIKEYRKLRGISAKDKR